MSKLSIVKHRYFILKTHISGKKEIAEYLFFSRKKTAICNHIKETLVTSLFLFFSFEEIEITTVFSSEKKAIAQMIFCVKNCNCLSGGCINLSSKLLQRKR